jgi:uroporphyrinogen-III synthase
MSLALNNRRIVVTRANADSRGICDLLRAQGAIPIEIPAIEIHALPVPNELQQLLTSLAPDDWLVFTSASGVDVFFDWEIVKQLRTLPWRIACVGDATANTIVRHGSRADFVPTRFTGRALAEQVPDVFGKRVIWLRPRAGNEDLEAILAQRGALIHSIETYETVRCSIVEAGWRELSQGVDAIIFASPSAVHGFVAELGDRRAEILAGVVVACIGPVTDSAARQYGMDVVAVPKTHDIPSLVGALSAFYTSRYSRSES